MDELRITVSTMDGEILFLDSAPLETAASFAAGLVREAIYILRERERGHEDPK